ncbi:MAG: heavy-metal-associated domain-containing protein [Chloroflexi bacterium]|nr:heavy-metal-associated domain-containing protein [Chloroflexota bacterium]
MSTHQITFAIQGMFCAKCAVTLEQALTRLDGIIAAHVNYATERATVMFNPAGVSLASIVSAVQREGFQVPIEQVTLNVDHLLYTSSAHTVERILSLVHGVVRVCVEIKNQQILLDVLSNQAPVGDYKGALAKLGLGVTQQPTPHSGRFFFARTVSILMLVLLSLVSAGAHVGVIEAALLHPPLLVIAVSVLAAYLVGWPFFHLAYDAFIQGKFDASVGLALAVFISLSGGLVLAIISPTKWLTDSGFLLAVLLTAGWFIARSIKISGVKRHTLLSILAGSIVSLAMFGVYFGILTALQSPTHALEQLVIDREWVGLVALGFGIQIGLYTHLHLVVHAAKFAGATAMTGTGTGTSTLGMIACCAHHLSDLAPLVALTGASSLSGAISFFNDWKYAFIALGLAMNAIGIIVTLRTIRKSKAHLDSMVASTVEAHAAPTCH